MYRRGYPRCLRKEVCGNQRICEKAFLGFFVCSNGLFCFREARANSVSSSPSSQAMAPEPLQNLDIFCSRNTIPPPVTMIVCFVVGTLRSAFVSASRNFFSPCLAKISGIDIPNFEATISSVSSKRQPVRRCRHAPTDDLPAPIIPMSAIDQPPPITPEYLINTWLQPGADVRWSQRSRLNGFRGSARLSPR